MNRRLASIAIVLLVAGAPARAQDYVQTNLVSNVAGMAPDIDPNLQGAWGLSFSTGGAFWVSDQASNLSTLYSVTDTQPPSAKTLGLVVSIPNQGGAMPNPNANGPTGQVSTGAPGLAPLNSMDFLLSNNKSAAFIFANMDGSISAWNGTTNATIETTLAGASFTGLAIADLPNGGDAQLYAADQNSGKIDIFNSKWQSAGSFTSGIALPTGYTAFNVQTLSVNGAQTLFVTFANQATGGGIVEEFTTNGTYIKTLINDTAGVHLDAPWGLTVAPAGWGKFGGDLLVGNNNANSNGLTEINAYNLTTGAFEGTVMVNGQPFSATELWALSFGSGGASGSPNTLFFTAGLGGNTNGLIGSLSAVPEPNSALLGLIAAGMAGGAWRWKNRRRGAAA